MTPNPPSIIAADTEIQERPVWKVHTPNDGSNIGGTQPTSCSLITEVVDRPGAIQLYVEGPSWSTMMAYCQRPLLFNQPDHIMLDFDLETLDNDELLLETDIIVVIPAPTGTKLPDGTLATGIMLNMSLQDLKGQLQNVMTQGAWVDIPGAKTGVLLAGLHHYTITGTWDAAKMTYGITSVTIDGTAYPVTQNAPGKPCNWTPGISIQYQITLNQLPAGVASGKTSIVVDHVKLVQFGK